jgi:alpha-beta hydrolase superfamily lysophospholipase
LALRAAARREHCVIGAIAVNPAIALQDSSNRLVPGLMAWNRFLRACSFDRGRFEWVENRPEFPDVNYTRNYLYGVHQLRNLISATWRDIGRVRVPTMIIQGDHDPVVVPAATKRLLHSLGSEEKELVQVASKRHGILRGDGAEVVYARIADWARSIAHRHEPLLRTAAEEET